MTAWTSDEPNKIGNTEELQILSIRRDGTLRKGDSLFCHIRVRQPLFFGYVGTANPKNLAQYLDQDVFPLPLINFPSSC